jgi:hypothetical protein
MTEAQPQAQASPDAPRIGAQLPPVLLPIALIAGVIASAAFDLSRDSALILSIALLIAGAWWVLWRVIADTRWAALFASWPGWTASAPLKPLPYTLPGSPSERMTADVGRFRHWLSHELLPAQATPVFAAVCAIAVALVMSAVLGAQALLLTFAFLATAQLALYLNKGSGNNNRVLFNLAMIALPFLLGRVVFKPLTPDVASLSAVAFALAAGLSALRARGLQNIGLGIAVLLLIVSRHTVGAFIVGALWLPVLLLPAFKAPRWWPSLIVLAGAVALS